MENKMYKSISKKLLFIFTLLLIAGFTGCKSDDSPIQATDVNVEAMQAIAAEDSTVLNFEANYQDDITGIASKVASGWVTVDVHRKINSVSRSFQIRVVGDSALGIATFTFSNTLIIRAKKDSNSVTDTILRKNYTAVVKRNLIFEKVNSSSNPRNNWKLVAWSAIQGGTTTSSSKIQSLMLSAAGIVPIEITSPNNFYLARGIARFKQLPLFDKNSEVTLTLKVISTTDDPDYVILNYGADNRGVNRNKQLFTLVSTVSSGTSFIKTYQAVLNTTNYAGYFHMVMDVLTKNAVQDDSTPVESDVWSLPYGVKNQ
jgi:hypothetical protein